MWQVCRQAHEPQQIVHTLARHGLFRPVPFPASYLQNCLNPRPAFGPGDWLALSETGHFLSGTIWSEQIANQKNARNRGKSKIVLKKTQNRNTRSLFIAICFVYLNNDSPK